LLAFDLPFLFLLIVVVCRIAAYPVTGCHTEKILCHAYHFVVNLAKRIFLLVNLPPPLHLKIPFIVLNGLVEIRDLQDQITNPIYTFLLKCFTELVLLEHANDTVSMKGMLAREHIEFFAKNSLFAQIALLIRVHQNVRLAFFLL